MEQNENVDAAPAAEQPVGSAAPAAAEKQPQPEKTVDISPVEEAVERTSPEAQPQEQEQTVEPYDLKFPDYLPVHEQTAERTAMLESFATLAPEAGMPVDFAQTAVDAYMDVWTA